MFQSIFSIVWHLGRELDFRAENRIFKNFLKSIKTCFVGVFWVFQGIFLALLSGVPDLFDRNKILSGGDLSHYQVPH